MLETGGPVKGWFARPLLAVAGALGGAALLALLEGVRASREGRAPFGAVVLGDAAVLAPLAACIGLAVAVLGALLDPAGRWSLQAGLRKVRGLDDDERARWAAIALVAPPATLAWMLVCAHHARYALATDAPALLVGARMSSVAVAALVFSVALGMAVVPLAARTLTAGVGPVLAGACGG